MNPDVVSRLSLYAKEKTTLTPDQREEINQILDELVQKCKGINTGQIGAAAHNPQEFRYNKLVILDLKVRFLLVGHSFLLFQGVDSIRCVRRSCCIRRLLAPDS